MNAVHCIRRALGGLLIACAGGTAAAQQVTYETGPDGVRYQVTRTVVQRTVPVTENRSQTQTTYRQQVVTENQQYQQVYQVPVKQYQLVPHLVGRWNPFIEPYWTYEYEEVTTYHQQVATVTMPTTRVTWAPETRTVDTPVTTYAVRPVEVTERVPMGGPATGGAQPLTANTSANTAPSATLAARPSAPASSPATGATGYAAAPPTYGAPNTYSSPFGGQAMPSDPPRQANGWQSPAGSRYQ